MARLTGLPRVIGLSGPDGSGKSTQVDALSQALRDAGQHVVQTYAYGCVLCRRAHTPAASLLAGRSGGRPDARRRLHALIDASDLAVRLMLARVVAGAQASARGRRPLVVTDRTPVDGLVRYADVEGTLTWWLLRRLLDAWSLVVVLDADPSVLEQRDGEHSNDELGSQRRRFARWAGQPRVTVLSTETAPVQLTAQLVQLALALPDSRPAPSAQE